MLLNSTGESLKTFISVNFDYFPPPDNENMTFKIKILHKNTLNTEKYVLYLPKGCYFQTRLI